MRLMENRIDNVYLWINNVYIADKFTLNVQINRKTNKAKY